ncbi:26S proteasome complex subunit [Sporothrix eucalyptigena]|uniref:26S proteasome complex subunit SEM1 n=1 Tax=Sporothrix eucalyptigena TaxID=1812306 RepID=A0ABP0CIS5_9PEZI
MASSTTKEDKPSTPAVVPADKPEAKAVTLGEDDEFEDFPVDDWEPEETEATNATKHLWEESWDDDDTSDDFSAQLKEEIKKVEAGKRR